MATTIYKCQITTKPCELNTQLTAAMCNEMTHMQDFQTKLYEYGFKPSKLRWMYWMVGYAFGLGSRLLGPRRILRTGIWVEGKAVHHYAQLLAAVDWDEETRVFIEKDQADEHGHIERWRRLLDGIGKGGHGALRRDARGRGLLLRAVAWRSGDRGAATKKGGGESCRIEDFVAGDPLLEGG